MPYLKKADKAKLGGIIKEFYRNEEDLTVPGQLNYLISMLGALYFEAKGGNYAAANDVVGALECAKKEFYRRVVAPLEDRKISENGDIF